MGVVVQKFVNTLEVRESMWKYTEIRGSLAAWKIFFETLQLQEIWYLIAKYKAVVNLMHVLLFMLIIYKSTRAALQLYRHYKAIDCEEEAGLPKCESKK